MKAFKKIFIAIAVLISVIGCDPLPEEEQTRFFLSNEWRLIDIKQNGVSQTNVDYSRYRLKLNEDQTLLLIDFDGTEREGEWQLSNADRELILFPGETNEQRFLILTLQLRTMELQTVLVSNKTGSSEFRFLFEPVP